MKVLLLIDHILSGSQPETVAYVHEKGKITRVKVDFIISIHANVTTTYYISVIAMYLLLAE